MQIKVEKGKAILATLLNVTEKQGHKGPYLMWVFTDIEGNRRVGFTESDIAVGNRPWSWFAMLGIDLKEGDSVELNEVRDIECLICMQEDKDYVRMVYRPKEVIMPETNDIKNPVPKDPEGAIEAEQLFG